MVATFWSTIAVAFSTSVERVEKIMAIIFISQCSGIAAKSTPKHFFLAYSLLSIFIHT